MASSFWPLTPTTRNLCNGSMHRHRANFLPRLKKPMSWIALIDATRHTDAAPPGRVVAGLLLLERAVRLAKVSGCTRVFIATVPAQQSAVEALAGAIDFDIALEIFASDSHALSDLLLGAAARDDTLAKGQNNLLILRSSSIYDRGLIHTGEADKARGDTSLRPLISTIQGDLAHLFEIPAARVPAWLELARTAGFATLSDATLVGPVEVRQSQKWQLEVLDDASAKDAEDRLWNSCRKDIDGIVSRLLNRSMSLAISRRIAHTKIPPTHISIITFSLGIIAAICAATGGYLGFLLAGLAYQANSVVDGVDGELARVKYEFSLLGEWLDTLSDDFKDVLFYGGLGIGAWRTVPFPGGIDALGAETWLWLGGIAVAGKLVSMAAYYTWLLANKRGDLLAFEWSFEQKSAQESTALTRAMSALKYLTKNDFIVFFAMLMAIVSALPYFLFIVAPGQFFIALSVIIQRIQGRKSRVSS